MHYYVNDYQTVAGAVSLAGLDGIMKMKMLEVLWLALQYAKSDRITFIDAYHNDDSEKVVIQAKNEIKAFDAMQVKIFGTNKSLLEKELDGTKSFSILRWLQKYPELSFDEFIATGDFSDKE